MDTQRISTIYKQQVGWFAISFVLFFCLSMRFAFPLVGIDPSWNHFLVNATLKHYEFSDKAIFTYGPSWFFTHHFYNPQLYFIFLFSSVFTSIIISFFIIGSKRKFLVLIFLAWVYLLFPVEEFWPVFILILLSWLALSEKINFQKIVIILWLSFISLSKFSYLIMITPLLITIDVNNMLCKRYKYPILLLIFLLGICMAYIILGQNILTLFSYLSNCLQIASGYSKAMGIGEDTYHVIYIFLFLAFISVLGLFRYHKRKGGNLLSLLLTGFAIMWSLLMVFKVGYVREDGHVFITQQILAFLLIYVIFLKSGLSIAYRAACTITLFVLLHILLPHSEMFRFSGRVEEITFNKSNLDKHYEEVKNSINTNIPIPKTATVNSYPWDLAELIMGGYNYVPSPIPQTYSAYTNKLQDINYGALLTDKPKYVLLKITDIDNRYPTELLGNSLTTLYLNYDIDNYCFTDNNPSLVLKGRESPRKKMIVNTFKSDFMAGAWFTLPVQKAAFREVRIDYRPNVYGEIMNFFLHQDYSWIQVETTTGAVRKFRFIPNVSNNGFILSPLINTTTAFVKYDSANKIKKIRIYSDKATFNTDIHIEATDFDMQGGPDNKMECDSNELMTSLKGNVQNTHSLKGASTLLYKVDLGTFKKFTDCNQITSFAIKEDGLHLTSLGDDPHFTLPFTNDSNSKDLVIHISITAPEYTNLQLYYSTKGEPEFSEKNSIISNLDKGENQIYLVLKKDIIVTKLRLDPGTMEGEYIIHTMDILTSP